MYKKKSIYLLSGMLLLLSLLMSCGQSRQDKTEYIINKLNLLEIQKTNFRYKIDSFKTQTTEKDSLRNHQLEKKLSDENITERITEAFNKTLSDKEIDDLYDFVQSRAFEKLYISGELFTAISDQFLDINNEIENIHKNLGKIVEKKINKFEPIRVEKENGFYATVDLKDSTKIKLEDKPSLTSKDILRVKKVLSNYNGRPEISIEFTNEGTGKFFELTKQNIGKPIAIVIAKQIVSMPIVKSEITGGKVTISGDFSEEEIDKMIKSLHEK